MTNDQFLQFKEEMNRNIQDSIKITVNGKIDKIDKKLDDYILKDTAWKETAQPAIKIGLNLKGFGAVSAYFMGVAATLSAAWVAIKWIAGLITNNHN